MQITLDTDNPRDLELVRDLIQLARPASSAEAQPTAQSKPAKKQTQTPPAPTIPDPEPEDPTPDEGPTVEDATARALELVSSGAAARVKAALNTVGAERVGLLEPDKIGAFVDSMERFAAMTDDEFAESQA